MFGVDDLARDLEHIGVEKGDGVFVHTALGQVGHVLGGPRGLIEALIETVGPSGLIGMPGFSKDAYDPVERAGLQIDPNRHRHLRDQVPGFDPERSHVRENGAVAETFRRWPGVVRSPHPTSSVLLFGADADVLSIPHDPRGWATGPDTPWDRLRHRPNMKILLIGVGWNRCSAMHSAESAAPFKRTVTRKIKLGPGPSAEWITAPDVEDDLNRLFPEVGTAWEKTGHVAFGQLGNAKTRLCDYGSFFDFACDWMNQRNKANGVPRFAR